MRFFSNDAAKENTEEQAHDDRMQVEQAVPQQRAGSPWSDAPGTADRADAPGAPDTDTDTADAELADRETRDGTEDGSPADGAEFRHERTDAVRDADAPGSHAVPEDLAADRGPDDGSRDDDTQVRDTGDAGPTDEPLTYGPDGTVRAADEPVVDEPFADRGRPGDEEVSPEQEALRDEGDFDSPQAVDPSTGEPLDSSEQVDSGELADRDRTVEDDQPVDGGQPVDDTAFGDAAESRDGSRADGSVRADEAGPGLTPVTAPTDSTAGATTDADTATDADAAPAVVAADTATGDRPGAVATVDRLFTDGATFVERFREIQLRFVDSPKEATGEAARLIGEAVDVLTNSLNTQRDSLASNSDDTEKLRVELRGYRDILNRLTNL